MSWKLIKKMAGFAAGFYALTCAALLSEPADKTMTTTLYIAATVLTVATLKKE